MIITYPYNYPFGFPHSLTLKSDPPGLLLMAKHVSHGAELWTRAMVFLWEIREQRVGTRYRWVSLNRFTNLRRARWHAARLRRNHLFHRYKIALIWRVLPGMPWPRRPTLLGRGPMESDSEVVNRLVEALAQPAPAHASPPPTQEELHTATLEVQEIFQAEAEALLEPPELDSTLPSPLPQGPPVVMGPTADEQMEDHAAEMDSWEFANYFDGRR